MDVWEVSGHPDATLDLCRIPRAGRWSRCEVKLSVASAENPQGWGKAFPSTTTRGSRGKLMRCCHYQSLQIPQTTSENITLGSSALILNPKKSFLISVKVGVGWRGTWNIGEEPKVLQSTAGEQSTPALCRGVESRAKDKLLMLIREWNGLIWSYLQ